LTSYTTQLNPEQAAVLERLVTSEGYELRTVPYARFSGVKKDHNVTFYQSGKLVVQGKGTREFVEFILEPLVLQEAKLGYESLLNPELIAPRIGVDESGKGDFFGPLCVAGVYVNEAILASWKEVGIRDSKNISSDKRMLELADVIAHTPGCVQTIVPIGNEAYNRLHASSGSVNRVLAWGHARVIENLLQQKDRMRPPPVRAISDQFDKDKSTVAKALMALGQQLELVQRHRAEEDMAVAAASILARAEYVRRMARLGKEYGMTFPKGASVAVEVAGKEFVVRHGAEALSKVAKMHFRTRYRVLGQPEPPKVEWRAGKKAGTDDAAEEG
jgi:ribonuclease HIII